MYIVGQGDVYFFFFVYVNSYAIYWQLIDCTGPVNTIYVFGQPIFQQVVPLVGCTEFSEINLISYTFICKQNFSFVRRCA
jgi:hypothetical protein